jgi:trk system potassium uptake protein TrkH
MALYVAGGMSMFDAVFHAFSTMGSGGFSTRNESIAAFHSPYIEWVTILFMLIAGFNFTLVYRLLQRRFREVAANSEARAYGILIAAAGLAAAFALFPQTGSAEKSLRLAFFHAASIISSTGYAISDHNNWAPLAQMAVFLLLFSGGCSGSTAGGIKIIRYVILGKQMKNEIRRALFPSGLFSIQLDNKPGRKDVIYSVAGFVCLYYFVLLAGTVMGTAAGMNLFDAVNAAAITTGNIGLGFGSLVSGGIFTEIPAWAVWGYSLLMITGRLELFTVLLLFVPEYWRRQA